MREMRRGKPHLMPRLELLKEIISRLIFCGIFLMMWVGVVDDIGPFSFDLIGEMARCETDDLTTAIYLR